MSTLPQPLQRDPIPFRPVAPDAPAFFRVRALGAAAWLSILEHDLPRADAHLTAAIMHARAVGDERVIASVLGLFGNLALARGAAATMRDRVGHSRDREETPAYQRTVAIARKLLGDAAFDAAWEAGRLLSREDVLAEANMLVVAVADGQATRPVTPHGLSRRELEVLRLLVDGKTDAEIAAALFVSRRTASTHVRHIYDKLGVASRSAAAYAVRHGLV
jgi:DNA-binding CsgD family transcriptional regulator